MGKVLFISAFHPHAEGNIGAGEAICGDNLKKIMDSGYDVDAIIISPQRQRANISVKRKCAKYIEIVSTKRTTIESILFNIKHGSLFAPWFFTRVQKHAVNIINKQIKINSYDFIWLDFPSALGFSSVIQHNDIRYCAHDVVTQRIERSFTKRWFKGIVKKIESNLIRKTSHIAALSEKDSALIKDMGYKGQLSIIKLGIQKVGTVDKGTAIIDVINQFHGKKNLIFFGNMKRSENHWSIIWFIVLVFIRLYRREPNLHLWVLGLSPRPLLILLAKCISNIHVIGPVDDPSLAFQSADICIAPLLFGAGVKIKVIQMLNNQAKVIATPIGAEGVPNDDNLTIISPNKFYTELLHIVEDI